MATTQKKLGLFTLTSLVTGNMVGSGVFLLPSDLARVGSISLLSWGFTALGAFLLAMVYSKMSSVIPKTGGPYAYSENVFGDFLGFQTAYTYWMAQWIGNCAIVVALVSYLRVFFPQLANQNLGLLVILGVVWSLTAVNIRGVRSAGIMQLVTTILKLMPLVAVIIFGWFYFHPEYLTTNFNISGHSNFSAFSYAATLTLWAFVGVESATVPAGSVDRPERNIPLATLFGTLISAVIYVASSTVIMGIIPAAVLANSSSPFAAAANIIFGAWGGWVIAAGAVISCYGALNGYILLQGQIAMAAAENNLFPRLFAKRNRFNVPAWGIIITSMLMSLLLLATSSPNLVSQFQLIILIATTSTLIVYFYTAISQMVWLGKHGDKEKHKRIHLVIALLASVYTFWAFFGSGEKIVFYVAMLLFSSFPLYAIAVWRKRKKKELLG